MAKIKGGQDYINLGSGHSRILGHKPNSVKLAQVHNALASVDKAQNIDEVGLGFFDSSSPNYTTYYPDATAEDFDPKDDEMIQPVFRALSNVTVHKQWNPVYFPENVLQESMPLLIGQTVNIDHETALGNAIGAVLSTEWQEKYKTGGKEIPAGINMVLNIDAKSNPRIARGIQMNPPSIHSNSVTVQFTWEPSHPEMETSDFWDKLGTYDADGKLIQRIATKIIQYKETSLVNHGADPFAKQIKDGKIINPTMAQRQYYGITANSALSDYSVDIQKRAFSDAFIDFKSFSETSLSADSTIPKTLINNISTQENSQEMDKHLAQLTVMLVAAGITNPVVTEENFGEKLKELNTSMLAFKAKAEANGAGTTEATFQFDGKEVTGTETIQNSINALEAKAKIGDTALTALREKTLANYKLAMGDKEDANMVKLIEDSNYEIASALNLQYEKQAEEHFSLTCEKCGSKEISRAAAKPEGVTVEEENHEVESDEEILKNIHKNRKKKNSKED